MGVFLVGEGGWVGEEGAVGAGDVVELILVGETDEMLRERHGCRPIERATVKPVRMSQMNRVMLD